MTQRDRIVIGVLGAIAVLAASWMLAIKPKRQEAADLQAAAQQAQQRRDTALASLAHAKQSKADFADAQAAIARMGKAVPSGQDVPTLVFQLERAARLAKIDFRSIDLQGGAAAAAAAPTPAAGAGTANPTAPADVKNVPFKLTFEGGFFDLRRFLDMLRGFAALKDGEHLHVRGRLLSVDAVSLQAGPKGFPDIKASIAATAYTAPAPSATAATAAPAAPGTGATSAGSATPSTGTSAAPTTATVTGVAR